MPYQVGENEFYATWEAAQEWGVSTRTVQRWIEREWVEAFYIDLDPTGSRYIYLIPPSEIRRVRGMIRRGLF